MVATSLRPTRRRGGPLVRTVKPAPARRVAPRPDLGERGFTLIEFMIAAAVMSAVLGATVGLAVQIQEGYGTQLDDVAVEQEARYALDWIARDLRSAGSDPYRVILNAQELLLDPDGDNIGNSITIRADINPPDGDILDGNENVTIAFDAANGVITRQDWNDPDDATAVAMTEAIFTGLSFTYLNASRAVTTNSELVAYIGVEVTAQSRATNRPGGPMTSTLATEVRLRTR